MLGLERQRIQDESRQQRTLEREMEASTRNRMKSLQNQHDRHRALLRDKMQETRVNCSQQER